MNSFKVRGVKWSTGFRTLMQNRANSNNYRNNNSKYGPSKKKKLQGSGWTRNREDKDRETQSKEHRLLNAGMNADELTKTKGKQDTTNQKHNRNLKKKNKIK